MDKELAKRIIERLDRNAFEAFFQELINTSPLHGQNTERLTDIDSRIYECPPERFYQSADVFLMCYSPYMLFKEFSLDKLDTRELKKLISLYISKRTYNHWLPIDGITLYVINNFDSMKIGESDEELLSYYEQELNHILPGELYRIGTGNCNTFASNPQVEIQSVLQKFLSENDEGISISLSDNGVQASQFIIENEFAGITKSTNSPVQPVLKKLAKQNYILDDFNKLIFSNAKESVLEDFLYEHYQVIFGGKYDTIKTQLWLKFPELDIGKRDRRLDIFMRNALSKDWELFELKRSNVNLTKTSSDVPMFVSAVNDAIAQMKNYKHLLSQDKVKRKLAAEGIEYYYPEINLVIGKKPLISNEQWRRLQTDNQGGFKLITYDGLIKEATQRLADMENLMG